MSACGTVELRLDHSDPYLQPWVVALTPAEAIDGMEDALAAAGRGELGGPRDAAPPRRGSRPTASENGAQVQRLDPAGGDRVVAQGARHWRIVEVDEEAGHAWLLHRAGGFAFGTDVILLAVEVPDPNGRAIVRGWARARTVSQRRRRLRELMRLLHDYWRERGIESAPAAAAGVGGGEAPGVLPY